MKLASSLFNVFKRFFTGIKHFLVTIKTIYKETHSVKAVFLQLLKQYKRQIFYTSLLIIAIIVLIPPATYLYFARDLKDKDSIMNRSKTGLTLLDREGKEFFTFNHPKDITYVAFTTIPVPLQEAVIASEDKNFYTNPGVSLRGIVRALFADLFAGKIVEGGSTITQELVKNAFLSSSQNFLRKYQEVVLAYELNRRYSKQDILELYMNSVYFGEGAFGIENAAEAYFGVHAKDLTLSESTLLVGLLPAPSAYSPLSNDSSRAIKQRHLVLTEMVGEKYISQDQANAADAVTPVYNPVQKADTNILAPHFALFVKDQLIKKYGEERVIRDGFTVKTTLNSTWQAYAERVLKNQVISLHANLTTNGAAVAIDPKTGEIEAMVGSYDWNDPKFGTTNMAVTPRQPGSSFKPIIYSAAFEQHIITPATILQDNPITYPDGYTPHDYDRKYRGTVTVRRALANSLNIPAVEVMNKVTVPAGLDQAKKLGITTLGNQASKYGLSLVLGAGEVKLLELTDAYAVFADKGVYNAPTAFLQIKDKYGKIVDTFQPNPQNALEDDTSYLISSILSDNITRAEEFGGALTISRPAAVKTGTTDNFKDALTIGYTPSLVVGVWVGNNDNTQMDNIAGSLGAAPIWRSLMETFLAGTPYEVFQRPTSVVSEKICLSPTGIDNIAHTSILTEYFIAGTQPTSCDQPTSTLSPSQTKTPTPTPTNTQPKLTDQPTTTPIPTDTPFPSITPKPTQFSLPASPSTLSPTTHTSAIPLSPSP